MTLQINRTSQSPFTATATETNHERVGGLRVRSRPQTISPSVAPSTLSRATQGHGWWRVTEDSPEIRGGGDPRRAPRGWGRFERRRERPRRVRRAEPVGSIAGGGNGMGGTRQQEWIPDGGAHLGRRAGGGVADRRRSEAERRRRGRLEAEEDWGVGGETRERIQRNCVCQSVCCVCLCYVAPVSR